MQSIASNGTECLEEKTLFVAFSSKYNFYLPTELEAAIARGKYKHMEGERGGEGGERECVGVYIHI